MTTIWGVPCLCFSKYGDKHPFLKTILTRPLMWDEAMVLVTKTIKFLFNNLDKITISNNFLELS